MAHIQGKVAFIFDNRKAKDGTMSKFPNFKFKIGDQELVLWASEKPDFLIKDALVSCTFGHSKKTGSAYIVNDPETKRPLIQALVSVPVVNQPDTSFNPDELEAELQTLAKTLHSDLTVETKKPFNKDEYMFVLACIKSSLESNQLGANKESIDTFIKDMKFIYNHNF